MSLETTKKNLEERGFIVRTFAAAAEAADYLDGAIDGTTVGFGGSITLQQMGLKERLESHNDVAWHWTDGPEARVKAAHAQVYISSVNGLAETGELINIDGAGNRVAATLYGHQRIYFVVGRNKLAPTYEEALWRARNIAAPKNAQRLGSKTPCAVKGDRCYDCKSPGRICRGLTVLWGPMMGMEQTTEVLLIDEDLGY
jgi:L-lactate utilization protein LutB